ncbi:aminopeptidase [Aliidiomarina taiwanensis]|uniref:Aminopeptidase n=1 Tax=Aliidiomarina taiwanensis TaxID=946228 RepID=A0A432X9P8_9GAMM|nr:PDZ domain-containing protein [Aliidiomarina taiwanensis]RUO44107.1 aminopeptidase [Aliidiomarina taiwanensis]
MIAVRIDLASPHHHYFDVSLSFEQPDPDGQVLRLPAWIPGSYMIRDFAKHIVSFEASSSSGALEYIRPDKSTWQLAPTEGPVTVRYRVYAYDASIRAAYLDLHYGFFNGTSLCLEVLGQSQQPHQVTLVPPLDPALTQWQVATGMPVASVDHNGFGSYQAENYDALIDYPFLLGELSRISFHASGIPHELVLVGKHYASQAKLAEDLTKICEAQHTLFGGAPDFDHYLFLTIVTDNGFGGLEHRNSTALMCPRDALEYGSAEAPRDAYVEFLSLCSHEYFHNWNIKRLKPKSFLPYQLDQESYTEQLWFYEGVTSFYDDLMVYRAGCISAEAYLKRLESTISRGLRGQGPRRQNLVESSQLAWTTFYQQNENAVNAISSYYAKGAVVAACLDLLLRKTSAGLHSLDTVMHNVWATYGVTGLGTSQEELLAVCNPEQHADITAFLEAALYSTKPLPWQALLAELGVQAEFSPFDPISQHMRTQGELPQVELGAGLQACPQGFNVQRVMEGSAAAFAGLSAGDTLIALDGLHATEKSLKLAQQRFQPGDTVSIHFFRDAQLHHSQLTWQAPVPEQVQLTLADPARFPWQPN